MYLSEIVNHNNFATFVKSNYMKKYYLQFIPIIMLFSFCNQQTKDYKLSKNVQKIADNLSKEKVVLFDETDSIEKFKALKNVATNEDFIYLTNSKIVLIRCYAFRGLTERNYSDIRKVFYNHVNDTSLVTVHLTGTCIVDKISVHEFMLDQLHPASKCKYKLSRREFDKYYQFRYK